MLAAMDGNHRPANAAADRRARSLSRYRTTAGALRDSWRRASAANPDEWWNPAAETLARAVAQGRDVRAACTALGRARAQAGLGIRYTLDDLFALYRQVPAGEPPNRAVRATVEAWAEVSLAPTGVTLCGDPRKGAATAKYVRNLLGGLYQFGDDGGAPLSGEFAVLVLEVQPHNGWEGVPTLLEMGDRLLPVLPAQALLIVLGPGRLGTLVRRTPALPDLVADLAEVTESVLLTSEIPEDLPAAYRLLERVAR
jgi:uncharacterized protein YukE